MDIDEVRAAGACGGGAPFDRYLNRVHYSTTSIDDGDVIDTSDCSESSAVSPVDHYGITDYGTFECPFDCNATPVGTVNIVYQ